MKFAVLTFSALLSMNAMAAEVLGICANIFDPFKCNRASICAWDNIEGRCEQTTVGGCYAIRNPFMCSKHPDCAWDNGEGRCEEI